MKLKIAAFALAATMLLLCAGCGGAESVPPANSGTNLTDGPANQGGGSDSTDGTTTVVVQPVEVTNETYGSFWLRCHDYKTMPVGAYNAVTGELRENASLYSAYKEAGVNMMIGGWEGVSLTALNLCADNGIGYLVSPRTPDGNYDQSALSTDLAQAKYHEAFCGVPVADEPGQNEFELIVQTQDYLDQLMPEMTKGMLWWSNLYPNYAVAEQLLGRKPAEGETYTYEQYVAEYVKTCKPKVLSYDNYACHVGKKNRNKIRQDYFPNLSVCRAAALKANIPFWHFIQACQFVTDGFAPSLGELLWMVNTGLSYGAKGIEYYTGIAATQHESAGYKGAMFNGAGERTEVYNYVKKADAQIAAVDEVLMCSKSKGLIVVGEMPTGKDGKPSSIPEGDLIETYGEYKSATAAHALIGCFDYNGKTAFYVTNNSVFEDDTVKITFGSSVSGYTVKETVKTPFSGTSVELAFGAGEGVLIVVE